MESREIVIGDTTYRIARFRGLKAALAGEIVSRVMQEVPQLQEQVTEFRQTFKEKNIIRITPGMAKLPRFAALGFTTEDFEAGGGVVEIPEEPDQGTIIMHIFPKLFAMSRKELERFLALMVIPNSQLEEADDADNVDEALSQLGKRLMRQGDIDELLELLVVGSEVFQDQMGSKRDRLGKIPWPALRRMLNPPDPEEDSERNGHGETQPTPSESSPSELNGSAPSSPTDSQPDSDGTAEPSSTESLGTN